MEKSLLPGGSMCGVLLDYVPCVNYSMVVNGVDVITRLVLTNDSDASWTDVLLTLTGNHVEESHVAVAHLPAGGALQVSGLKVMPRTDALLSLTEAVETSFTLTIKGMGQELWRQDYPLTLLAHDQWTGSNIMPHLLAAFVVPNSPLLAGVCTRAAAWLQQHTGNGALDGYQAQNRNRVRQQVAAFYEALREQGIVYCNPPASFERWGQRIRLADKVLNEKLATCIDTSLLMASCLEAVGINPVIVMMRTHAMVGAWLQQGIHPDMVCDDPTLLLKESADGNNNLVLLESTMLTHSGNASFDEAVAKAMSALRDEREFVHFIDIHRCRLGHVRPLPQQGQMTAAANQGIEHPSDNHDVNALTHYDLQLDQTNTPLTKQMLWERKLLDFTLRNNLLNMRLGKRVVPFISFGIDSLEDHLQDGEDYTIAPTPDKKIDPNEHGIYDSQQLAMNYRTLVTEMAANNQLLSYLTEAELQGALKFIYRSSRTALEENGANSLFLALGLIKWYESDRSEQPRFAPVLLLPVDIIRRAGNKYIIRKRDEDIIFNITLVELLKQNFNINLEAITNLPTDHSGVDVKMVFTFIRRAIMEQRRWDLIEESVLGLFSFNKFVMWNDIHSNAHRLRENAVVASLMDGMNHLPNDAPPVDTRQIDRQVPPHDFAIPLDVDSSQMEAVVKSGRGQSFILHGPPGTGKSQTITNMIANALYKGKRVLFVAEKMAALEVVQSRLARIGLDAFCLELHSNKVTKSHFLSQMDKALNVTRVARPQDYKQQSQALFEQRQELINYMEALHQRGSNGVSLHDCISHYLAIDGDEQTQQLPPVEQIDNDFLQRAQQHIAQIDAIIQVVGNPAKHPLRGIDPTSGDNATLSQLQLLLDQFASMLDQHERNREALNKVWPLTVNDDTQMRWVEQMSQALSMMAVMNHTLLQPDQTEAAQATIDNYLQNGRQCQETWRMLTERWSPNIATEQDAKELRRQWNAIGQKWFLPKFFATRKMVKALKPYGLDDANQIDILINTLDRYQSQRAALDTQTPAMAPLVGRLAILRQERWDDIESLLQALPVFNRLIAEHAHANGATLHETVALIENASLGQWNTLCTNTLPAMNNLLTTWKQLQDLCAHITMLAHISGEKPIETIKQKVQVWLPNMRLARDWCHWAEKKRQLQAQGLSALSARIEENGNSPAQATAAVLKGAYRLLIEHIIEQDPQLRMFNGLLFHQKIEAYRKQTALFQELSKQELYCTLAARVPDHAMASAGSSEVSILKRYITNGGRGTSIRTIIDSIPTLLPRLCPCMLMSPISVAQYIDLGNEKFDLVIFDEASQMPTSEAIGAIARGKSLVVVGDSKQMPPTSFFSSSQVDEDEADIDDMESILDDCKILSMDESYLTWHYRSKHESLIAFSNAQYYDNRLLTFPSIDDREVKVRFVPIEGQYDKGHTRCNPAEAQAIVNEVLRRLADDVLSRHSMGVVSFSKVQQNLIEDILTDELDKRPDLKAVAYDGPEPIFIKNLENVQGDERDVILFSVGYGPDKHGRVSLNFGPLNNVGGERRLNVAVSRARYEMIVFSTLQPQQIDLNRTNALGVEGLKAFLEYAQTGRLAATALPEEADDTQNVIAEQIVQALEQRGYKATKQVGRSSFKIDVAVAARSNPDRYLLGILCDGKNYYETRTTRDREIVQPSILTMLHWHIMRVYSIDWYSDSQRVITRILDRLDQLERGDNSDDDTPQPPLKVSLAFDPKNLQSEHKQPIATRNAGCRPYNELTKLSFNVQLKQGTSPGQNTFNMAVQEVLLKEQPVTLGYLCKRVARLMGYGHVGSTILGAVSHSVRKFYKDPLELGVEPFYWYDEESPEKFTGYRAPSARTVDEIPAIEIINAIKEVVDEEFSLQREQIHALAARKFGFASTRAKFNAVVQTCVEHLIAQDILRQSGTTISLNQ